MKDLKSWKGEQNTQINIEKYNLLQNLKLVQAEIKETSNGCWCYKPAWRC